MNEWMYDTNKKQARQEAAADQLGQSALSKAWI